MPWCYSCPFCFEKSFIMEVGCVANCDHCPSWFNELKKNNKYSSKTCELFFNMNYWDEEGVGILYDFFFYEWHDLTNHQFAENKHCGIKHLIGAKKTNEAVRFLIQTVDDTYWLIELFDFESNRLEKWRTNHSKKLDDLIHEIMHHPKTLQEIAFTSLDEEQLSVVSPVVVEDCKKLSDDPK